MREGTRDVNEKKSKTTKREEVRIKQANHHSSVAACSVRGELEEASASWHASIAIWSISKPMHVQYCTSRPLA